jgi:pSer/pThr/pTyr-binding forkhead associated (FHA) protein
MARCFLLATSGPYCGCGVCVKPTESVLIGRDVARGLSIRDDLYLSREHFSVRGEGNYFKIVDSRSRNGTFVNGHRIEATFLRNGDLVRAGGTEFRVEISQELDSQTGTISSYPAFPNDTKPAVAPQPTEFLSNNQEETKRYLDGLPELLAVRTFSHSIESQTASGTVSRSPEFRQTDSSETVFGGPLISPVPPPEPDSSPKTSSPTSVGSPTGVDSDWLNQFGLQPTLSHASYYGFQGSNLELRASFLQSVRHRIQLYLIVNRMELPATDRPKLREIAETEQVEMLSDALLSIKECQPAKFESFWQAIYRKDACILFGVAKDGVLRTKDLQRVLSPLSYPSVLAKTFAIGNLVIIDTLLRGVDFYLIESSSQPNIWLLYTSPRFFGIYRD